MDVPEQPLSSKKVFCGKIINVKVDQVLLATGKKSTREVVEHAGAAAILALTAKQEVLLVKQYRYPIGRDLLELPAGKIDEPETPLTCAQRELQEETGYQAQNWRLLWSYFSSPGFTNEKIYLYLAEDLRKIGGIDDQQEIKELKLVPLTEAQDLLKRGLVKDGKTILGLLAVTQEIS